MTWPVVCATGHRPQHLDTRSRGWVRDKLPKAARWLRDERGTQIGLSGMATGVDLWWASAVVGAGLSLGAYVPCPQQPDRWSRADRREWQRLWDLADPELSRTFADAYSPAVMHERNDGMLRDSDAVLCVWLPSKRSGGTWNAVRSAHASAKPGMHLDPGSEVVSHGLPDLKLVGAARL